MLQIRMTWGECFRISSERLSFKDETVIVYVDSEIERTKQNRVENSVVEEHCRNWIQINLLRKIGIYYVCE